MGDNTTIGWTQSDDGSPGATWNPSIGCSRVSPECDACYAMLQAPRQADRGLYEGVVADGDWTGRVNVAAPDSDRMTQPLRWKRPRRIFVNSMSDLFHEAIGEDDIARVFDVMVRAHWHTFQVLTKRPQRMARVMSPRAATPEEVDQGCELGEWPGIWDRVNGGVPAPNIWLGTSIGLDRYAFRERFLLATPAAVRFVSAEPLLSGLPSLRMDPGLHWVIVGGESGRTARRMDPEWARDLAVRCGESGTAFFMKQAGKVLGGEWGCPDGHGTEWSDPSGTSWYYPEWARRREFPA